MSTHPPELPVAPRQFWLGESTLYSTHMAALVISRQARSPHGGRRWLQRTVEAAQAVAGSTYTLMAGVGLPGWELPVAACSEAMGQLILLVPVRKVSSLEAVQDQLLTVVHDFGLVQQNSLLIPYWESPELQGKALWPARDRWILEQASRLYPISLRPGGNLAGLLEEGPLAAKRDDRFLLPGPPEPAPRYQPPDPAAIAAATAELPGELLFHWTRRSQGPWPGETRERYYGDLVASQVDPRSAFQTLRRICGEERLRASGWRMPLGRAMVSFSACQPGEMAPRMRWRRRFAHPAFEPYGIALPRRSLEKLGARPVVYLDKEDSSASSTRERLFEQRASERSSWTEEKEWRLQGDLDLRQIPREQWRLLVRTRHEAEQLAAESGAQVLALEE